jgi:hypothetical protein
MAEEESATLLVRQLIASQQTLTVAQAATEQKLATLTETVSKITASWKDKAVTQIGAIAIAALSIIGAQYAMRAPAADPRAPIVQRTELDIRAEGCAKMANGVPEAYARCMVDQVVAPGANRVADSTAH